MADAGGTRPSRKYTNCLIEHPVTRKQDRNKDAERGAGAFVMLLCTFRTGIPDKVAHEAAALVWKRRPLDPSFVITHRIKLDDAPEAYRMFRDKKDGCIVVIDMKNAA